MELWMRGALASVLRCSKLCNMERSDGIAWPFSNQHLESRQMVVLKRGCIARVPSHASHGGGDAKTYGESGEIQGPCSFARPGCKRAVCTHVPPHNPAADVYMRPLPGADECGKLRNMVAGDTDHRARPNPDRSQ